MKTMKAGAVVLLGMVLAAPVWGQWSAGFIVDPNDPLRCEIRLSLSGIPDTVGIPRNTWRLHAIRYLSKGFGWDHRAVHFWGPVTGEIGPTDISRTFSCGRFAWDTRYETNLELSHSGTRVGAYETPPEPEPTEPEPPAPPPEPEPPEPPEPEPPEPEPETPEPETPEPEACPAEPRCDHLAIVAAMPKALPGDEDAADHWVRITNPGAASIRFTIEGRDEAGAKGGTYRRELPAYRSVKVKMRDIQAAFDVTDPEGWWWLRVAGSGPIDVAATMKQGDARRFVPVERPATCGTGPVTRTGG